MKEYEHDLIGKIVKVVSNNMNRGHLNVVEYPVGLESRVHKVNSLLNNAGSDGVCMIGIHGTGGIGKSTLARAVYNLIADQFECLCFLGDVRGKSAIPGLEYLQQQLLYKTIRLKMEIEDVNEGILIIKERLCRKKVLLILDNVDELKQLNLLAGRFDWFGPNSRVIITTQDKNLLTCHGIERMYEVDGFNKVESLELFMWKAFKSKKVGSVDVDIVKRAITYASGLPLAIDVIGSNFSGKPVAEWKSMLDKYERFPPNDIKNILKISYDGFDEEQKNLFLDIACFFKGFRLEKVEGILNAHYGYCIKHDFGVLVDKSLIKIDPEEGVVWLHDLIENMGREIVRIEEPDHPEERTRLWFHEDIFKVLKENKGTSKTKMIYLNCRLEGIEIKGSRLIKIKKKIDWNGEAFKKMEKLKTLVIENVDFSQGSQYFPSSLRVLDWEAYPSTPSSIINNQNFEDMKVLKFDFCEYLTKISNVSCLPNLEEFTFEECKKLITIDNSIGFLSKLKILNAAWCTKLRSFPPLKLPSLKTLRLGNCESLQNFPEILVKIENIRDIFIHGTSIRKIPVSFQNLIGLSEVTIALDRSCGKLMFPGDIFCKMPKVKCVQLTHSDLSLCLPMAITWFANMTILDLSDSDFRVLPECLKECIFLDTLTLNNCYSLVDITAIPPNLKRLSALNCKSLNSSSKSMLLSKNLHESRRKEYFCCFPSAEGEMMPEWFNHQSIEGTKFPFWFRNKFPLIMIFFSTNLNSKHQQLDLCLNDWKRNQYYEVPVLPNFIIDTFPYRIPELITPNHTYLFDLRMEKEIESYDRNPPLESKLEPKLKPKVEEALKKNEWIQAEVNFESGKFHLYFEEENNVDNISFTNPYY